MSRKNKPLPSQQELQDMFNYNPDTGVLSWKPRQFNSPLASFWNTRYANKEITTKNSAGYLTVSINKSRYLVHRVVWKMINGSEPTVVDHIDCSSTNNTAINLRDASESLSAFNKRLSQGKLPHGVQPNGYRFMARIANKYLGTYATPEEAHEVYCLMADTLYNRTPPTSSLQNL